MTARAEWFEWGPYRYDIARAKDEAAARDHERGTISVDSWAAMLGVMRIDEQHVPTRPLAEPLLVVRLGGADGPPMVIDGWHRIAKAHDTGVPSLPAILIDEAAEAAARLR
jgi:hypothetical protein